MSKVKLFYRVRIFIFSLVFIANINSSAFAQNNEHSINASLTHDFVRNITGYVYGVVWRFEARIYQAVVCWPFFKPSIRLSIFATLSIWNWWEGLEGSLAKFASRAGLCVLPMWFTAMGGNLN